MPGVRCRMPRHAIATGPCGGDDAALTVGLIRRHTRTGFLSRAEPSVARMCLYMEFSLVVEVDHHRLQAGDVEDADVLLLHGDEAVFLEAREEPAHGLER